MKRLLQHVGPLTTDMRPKTGCQAYLPAVPCPRDGWRVLSVVRRLRCEANSVLAGTAVLALHSTPANTTQLLKPVCASEVHLCCGRPTVQLSSVSTGWQCPAGPARRAQMCGGVRGRAAS